MKYWFPIAVSCLCLQGWADARSELSLRLAELDHLACDFTQRIEDARGDLIEEASGRVRLLPPRFRWEVTQPYSQLLIAAGGELKLYEPDLAQVTVRPIEDVIEDTPLALLTRGEALLGEEYDVKRLDGGRFSVRPRAGDTLFEEIVLAFGSTGLVGIRIHDHLGQRTVIRLHGFRDASVIQSADFELIVPPGTDVN